jgi:hypothetical protein
MTGERGRFRFLRATTTSADRIVLDFIGGQGRTRMLAQLLGVGLATERNWLFS